MYLPLSCTSLQSRKHLPESTCGSWYIHFLPKIWRLKDLSGLSEMMPCRNQTKAASCLHTHTHTKLYLMVWRWFWPILIGFYASSRQLGSPGVRGAGWHARSPKLPIWRSSLTCSTPPAAPFTSKYRHDWCDGTKSCSLRFHWAAFLNQKKMEEKKKKTDWTKRKGALTKLQIRSSHLIIKKADICG